MLLCSRPRWFSVWAALAAAGPEIPGDPWEPFNRKVFAFNEGFDRILVEPAAKGWDFVLAEGVQNSIKNVFDNLFMPAVFVNHLLQGNFGRPSPPTFRAS